MPQSHVNERVRLKQDVPELGLRCGETGVVRSEWFAQETAYEVEFRSAGPEGSRKLLQPHQLEFEESDPPEEPAAGAEGGATVGFGDMPISGGGPGGSGVQ